MRVNKRVLFLFFILFFLYSFHTKGNIILSGNSKSVEVTEQFKIIEEGEIKIDPEQITSGNYDSKFSENKLESKIFNRQKRTFWVRLDIESQSDKNSEWLIKFWNYYSLIDCYTMNNRGNVRKQTSGWSLGLNERSVKNAELLFGIFLRSNESATVYFHITSDPAWNNPPEIRAEIISADEWTAVERNHWLLNGLFAGLVIIATLFSILNFFYGRKLYLFSLALSNLVVLFYLLNSNNIVSAFIFSQYPWYIISRLSLNYFCLPLFVSSIGLLFITFGELYKNLPKTSRLYIGVTTFVIIATIAIPAMSLSESFLKYLYIILFGWAMFHLVVWVNMARKKSVIGRNALICYTAIGLGLFVEYLRQLYIIEDNIFVRNAFQIGATLTATISMFTFLNFARELRKKKIKAQREKEQLLTEQNIMLENKVEQRTSELRVANDNLNLTLQNLKEAQSSLIKAEKQKETEIIRSRISRDIHDDISSELNKISWMSELIKTKSQKGPRFEAFDLLEKISTSSRNTISKLGEIIWAVKPENDSLESLLSYLRNHISNFLDDTSVNYKIDFPESSGGLTINPELKRNIFLVLKEALNNSMKYSKATSMNFTFAIENSHYHFSIGDNGIGIEENVIHGSGNGLINMKSRIENTGGSFGIETGKGKGTIIILRGELY